MKFSVFLTFHELDPTQDGDTLFADHLEQAKLADRTGYNGVSIPEHPLVHLIKSPNALLNAVAIGQHVSCEVGVMVIILPLHHPLALAGQIAEADHALGGRLVLGVGRGAYRYEFDRYGVDFNSSRAMFTESLDILESIWHSPDGAVAYRGDYWSFADTYVWPRPVRRPHPPVWIAGQTAATIEWAVDHGYNVVNALMRRPDAIVEEITKTFHNRREMVGLERGEIKLGISRPVFVSDDPARVQKRIEENQTLHKIHTHMHNFTEHADRRSYVPPLPVIDLPTEEQIRTGILLGPAGQILERIERYCELGIDELTVGMGYGAPHAEVMDSLQDFAENVIAPFRAAHGIAAPGPAGAGKDERSERTSALHARDRIIVDGVQSRHVESALHDTSYVMSKAWIRLVLHRAGNGPALVLVPGSAAHAGSLGPLRDALSTDHTVYTLERRGRGDSADETALYGLTREAETDLVQALNAIGEPVVLVGDGYGAALAVRAANLAQIPLRGLVLFAGGGVPTAAHADRLRTCADAVDALVAAGDPEGAVAAYLAQIGRADDDLTRRLQSRDDWAGRVQSAVTISRELRELADFQSVPEQLANLAVPVMVIAGQGLSDDNRASLAELVDQITGAELVDAPDIDALTLQVEPEQLVDPLRRFLGSVRELAASP